MKGLLTAVLIVYITLVSAKDSRVTYESIERVLHSYTTSDLPTHDEPVHVKIGVYVNNLQLDYQKGIMHLSVYFRMSWKDDRLTAMFDNTDAEKVRIVDPKHVNRIWKPDLFVRNSDKVARVNAFTDEELLRVSSDGSVWHVIRLINSMNCPQLLAGYRESVCPIMFESFGYTMDNLVLTWLDSPCDIDKAVVIPSHTLEDTVMHDCSQNYTAGAFPCLEQRFMFRSEESATVFEKGIYVISILLVIISWLAFWIPPTEKRIFIGLGTGIILAMLFMAIAEWRENSYAPRTTAAQVWTVFCGVLVLAMVLEYALVYVLFGTVCARVKGLCGGTLDELEPKRSRCGDILDTLFGLIVFPAIFIIGMISFGATTIAFT